jgi:copper(I)-binding protein
VGRRVGAVLAALVVAVASCGGDDDSSDEGITVTDAWARTTPNGVTIGAVYLRVTSDADDELTGADVDPAIAASVELHSTETSADGTATMEQQDALAVPAGGELVLEPIGNHLMLVDLADPLTTGETFDVTLHFATAGDEVVEVEVREDAP